MLFVKVFVITHDLSISFLGHLICARQVELARRVRVAILAVDFDHPHPHLFILVRGDLAFVDLLTDDELWGEVLDHFGVFEC